MIIGKEFTFESAHYLPKHERCGSMHGHTYKLTVEVSGEVNPLTQMVMDLHLLSDLVRKQIEKYDHYELNCFHEVPTCEVLAGSLAINISKNLPEDILLHSVKLQEGAGGYAIWNK